MPKKKQALKYPKIEESSFEKEKKKNLSLNTKRKKLKLIQIKLI